MIIKILKFKQKDKVKELKTFLKNKKYNKKNITLLIKDTKIWITIFLYMFIIIYSYHINTHTHSRAPHTHIHLKRMHHIEEEEKNL